MADALRTTRIPRHVFRFYERKNASFLPFNDIFQDTDPDGGERWPSTFLGRFASPTHRFLSPPAAPWAYRFQDLNGDGRTDILYHPTFVAGMGIPQPWVSYLDSGSGDHLPLSDVLQDNTIGDVLADHSPSSAYIDLDRDGVVDRLLHVPLGEAGGSRMGSFMAGGCAWWLEHQGGYIDPPRDPFKTIGAFLPDDIANDWGLRDGRWDAQVNALFPVVPSGVPPRDLPVPLGGGGTPGGFQGCYKSRANSPIVSAYFRPSTLVPNAGMALLESGRLGLPQAESNFRSAGCSAGVRLHQRSRRMDAHRRFDLVRTGAAASGRRTLPGTGAGQSGRRVPARRARGLPVPFDHRVVEGALGL